MEPFHAKGPDPPLCLATMTKTPSRLALRDEGQLLSFHILTNALSRNSFPLTILQMPGGMGGSQRFNFQMRFLHPGRTCGTLNVPLPSLSFQPLAHSLALWGRGGTSRRQLVPIRSLGATPISPSTSAIMRKKLITKDL
jgi:hypothetical protein